MENTQITKENISNEILEILNELLHSSCLIETKNAIFEILTQLNDKTLNSNISVIQQNLLCDLNRLFHCREKEILIHSVNNITAAIGSKCDKEIIEPSVSEIMNLTVSFYDN